MRRAADPVPPAGRHLILVLDLETGELERYSTDAGDDLAAALRARRRAEEALAVVYAAPTLPAAKAAALWGRRTG